MSQSKRLLLPFLGSISLLLAACGPQALDDVKVVPQPVKVVEVRSDLKEPVREFPGRIAASESANIASKVAGQVKVIYVQAGDDVEAGDLLLELDATDYQLNLDQAQANYNLAKVSFDRVESSRKRNIATQADYDNAKANLELTQVGLTQAKNQLADTKIKAPFTGSIVRVNPKVYDFVGSAQPLVFMQSTDNIDVKFQVPSDLLMELNEDDVDAQVTVIFDSLPDQAFLAEVREFTADSDRSTRGFDATLTLSKPPQEKGLLLPGMDATVLLDMSVIHDSNTLTVPAGSVFRDAGASYVWKVIDNLVVKTQVSLGEFRSGEVTVTSGLQRGDTIVAAGVAKLSDGQAIAVWSGE